MSNLNISAFRNKKPILGDMVYIDDFARVIGNVTLGDDCSVWPMAVIRGDMHFVTIGARTNIQDGSVLHVTHAGWNNTDGIPLQIGSDVTVGHNVVLHACQVGNLCLIGMGSTIMDGTVIEDRTMIGAGSLVTPGKYLESGYLYHGNPAIQVRKLTSRELEFLQYSANHYVDFKNTYMNREIL